MNQNPDSSRYMSKIKRSIVEKAQSTKGEIQTAGDCFHSDSKTAFASREYPERLESAVEAIMPGKSLCRTSTGSLALVHGEVEAGDRVFITRGATVPFIIRPTDNDEAFNNS